MESYQKELAEIRGILKSNPKGMTVTDIAREIRINRNSVAKYLDVLLISGYAEMVTFGPAKVFFPSRRVPLAAMLNFTTDAIILLDRNLKIVQVNEQLLRLLEKERREFLGEQLQEKILPFVEKKDVMNSIIQALDGKESAIDVTFKINGRQRYLLIKFIPTTFDDGEPGVTVIVEDTTKRKIAEEKRKQVISEWETTFNSITDMISIHDIDFTIIKANKAFLEMFEQSGKTVIGKKCYDVIHGAKQPHQQCPCFQVHKTKQPHRAVFFEKQVNKNIEVSASPLVNDKGEVTGSVHIIKEMKT